MTASRQEIDDFWDALERESDQAPLELETERDDFYSQPEWSVHRMHYTGLDGQRLFAWLSVPQRPHSSPTPALLRMPDYASVHDIIYTSIRHDAVVMNPTFRGQRGSDATLQAAFPGLLTQGIEERDTYVMLRVFADGLRAVQALRAQSVAEVGTIALTGAGLGGSLALAVAARWSQVKAVAVDTPLALGHPDVLATASAYPLAELNDYLGMYPERREAVMARTAPLNPVIAAPKVEASVLLSLGRRDRGLCPLAIGEELAAQLPHCDLRVYDGGSEGGGYPHSLVRTAWLKERLGVG